MITPLISCLIFGGVLAVVAVFAVGLYMAMSDRSFNVVEDTGEYE